MTEFFKWFGRSIFFPFFYQPIINLLFLFYIFFLFIKIPGAFGFAIIALTVLIRVILHPFFNQQIETARKMQDLKPHLDRLSQKHKKDPKTLQSEQMKLYQQAGINPASGCLFMIIQMPIFIALYQALYEPFKHGGLSIAVKEINKITYSFLKIKSIDPWFFGFNLAMTPAKSGQWHYYLIPVLTGVLQYLQVSVSQPPSSASKVKEADLASAQKPGETKKEDTGDFQKAMNTQMKFIFPLMIGWFSYSLPVGLSLYWNIFSIFTIIQYRKVNKK